jgi:hypothetical protein
VPVDFRSLFVDRRQRAAGAAPGTHRDQPAVANQPAWANTDPNHAGQRLFHSVRLHKLALLSGCEKHTFPTGQCLTMTGGGSAIATCSAYDLNLAVYSSADCSGASQEEQQPLNQCLQDNSGTYIYNSCSSSVSSMHSDATVHSIKH